MGISGYHSYGFMDIDRKYLYLWIGNKYYILIFMDNIDYYLGKMLGRLLFLDFVEDINYGPWMAMEYFRHPKTPKGGTRNTL